MIALANAIMRDYKAEGYEAQELEVKDDGHGNRGYIVQIRNTAENAGGFLKKNNWLRKLCFFGLDSQGK